MRASTCFAVGLSLFALTACGGTATNTGTGAGGPGGAGSTTGPGGTGGTSSTTGSGAAGGAGGSGGATGGASASSSSSSSSSSSGAGGSGGSPAVPQCTDPAQCTLVNDCCSCVGIGPMEAPPPCNVPECFIPTCTAQGHPNTPAACSAGQCVAGFDCDHSKALCNTLPPACPAGQTATVTGGCWGACVPATECASVGSCAQCSAGQVCVKEILKVGPVHHCVTPPAGCGNAPDCACMGGAVCVAPFDACGDEGPGVLACSCPSC